MKNYELKPAGTDNLGGIKVGDDFVIAQDGTLNIRDMEQLKQAVSELPNQVAAGKAQVAAAITEKGVDTAADASFTTMADSIRAIPKGGVSYTALDPQLQLLPYTLL